MPISVTKCIFLLIVVHLAAGRMGHVHLSADWDMVLNASGPHEDSIAGNTSGFLGNRSMSPESGKVLEPGMALKDDFQMAVAIFCVPSVLYLLATDMLRQPSLTLICFVSGVYMVASLAMNILNKRAAQAFEGTCLLVTMQMLVSVLVIVCMERDKLKVDKWADFLRWLIVPFAFAGMLGTSMFAFKEASLTTILIIRNILPILSSGFEKVLFNQPESVCWKVVMSLLVTLAGSVLYGFVDVSATNLGKMLILVNCAFTIVDRLVQAKLLKGNKDFSISIPMCMLLNNALGIVPMMVLAAIKGEVAHWGHTLASAGPDTWFLVMMSGLCGASLGYVGLRMQQLVSGTTVLVMQNFNKLLIIGLGMFLFHEHITTLSFLGCLVSLLGCFAYGYLRLPAEAKSKDASTPPKPVKA